MWPRRLRLFGYSLPHIGQINEPDDSLCGELYAGSGGFRIAPTPAGIGMRPELNAEYGNSDSAAGDDAYKAPHRLRVTDSMS